MKVRGRLLGFPKALRTHILRLLGPKTILCKALGYFEHEGSGDACWVLVQGFKLSYHNGDL